MHSRQLCGLTHPGLIMVIVLEGDVLADTAREELVILHHRSDHTAVIAYADL
ncbi:hypothetical protein D3C71_1357810 [compost metagenome]